VDAVDGAGLFVAVLHLLDFTAGLAAVQRNNGAEDGAGAVLETLAAFGSAFVPLAPLSHGAIDRAGVLVARTSINGLRAGLAFGVAGVLGFTGADLDTVTA